MRMKNVAKKMSGRKARGFSLLELMLVLAIMGLLMGVVAYNLLGQGDKAKKKTTEASLFTLKGAVDTYILEYSVAPANLQLLVTAKIIDSNAKLKDGWESDFLFDPTPAADRKYGLGSAGPDKQPGTEDDIDAMNINKK